MANPKPRPKRPIKNRTMKDQDFIDLGFNDNTWYDNGTPYYWGFAKDGVLIEKIGNKYYVDGTEDEIKSVEQLKALYFGHTGNKLKSS